MDMKNHLIRMRPLKFNVLGLETCFFWLPDICMRFFLCPCNPRMQFDLFLTFCIC